MRIGIGSKNKETGILVCGFKPLGMFPTTLEFRKATERKSDNSPTHEVWSEGNKVGAAWHKPPRDPGQSGFLSVNLNSPAFPGGVLNLAVFQAKEPGREAEYDLVWDERRAESQGHHHAAPPAAQTTGGAAGPDDDDIPF